MEGNVALGWFKLLDCRVVTYLLSEGANVGTTGLNGMTALHYAALSGSSVMARKIIDAGSSLDPIDNQGLTPLLMAMVQMESDMLNTSTVKGVGYGRVVSVLIDAGADVNIITPGTGRVPLHYMALTAQKDIVEKLLLAGADPNVLASDGRSPLLAAYSWGYVTNSLK